MAGGDVLTVGGHTQGVIAAQAQVCAAVAVGGAVIHAAGAVGKVAGDVQVQDQRDLAVVVERKAVVIHLEHLGVSLGLPAVQRAALIGVGELLGVQIAALGVAVQRQGQARVHGGGQLILRQVGGQGDGGGGVLRQGDLPVDVGVCGIGIC